MVRKAGLDCSAEKSWQKNEVEEPAKRRRQHLGDGSSRSSNWPTSRLWVYVLYMELEYRIAGPKHEDRRIMVQGIRTASFRLSDRVLSAFFSSEGKERTIGFAGYIEDSFSFAWIDKGPPWLKI